GDDRVVGLRVGRQAHVASRRRRAIDGRAFDSGAEVDRHREHEPARVVGVLTDEVDPARRVRLHARRNSSAARAGSTGLNWTPLPSSPAATKRGMPGARYRGATWTCTWEAAQWPPSVGR